MLLPEKVEEFKGSGVVLHIGSASSFFFVGTAEEFFDVMETLSAGWKTYFIDAAKASKADCARLKAKRPSALGLLTYTAKLSNLQIIARRYAEKKKRFKPLAKREVLNSYPRLEPNTYAIIAEGDEMGAYGCREDWDAANRHYPVCMKSKAFAGGNEDGGEPYAEV